MAISFHKCRIFGYLNIVGVVAVRQRDRVEDDVLNDRIALLVVAKRLFGFEFSRRRILADRSERKFLILDWEVKLGDHKLGEFIDIEDPIKFADFDS